MKRLVLCILLFVVSCYAASTYKDSDLLEDGYHEIVPLNNPHVEQIYDAVECKCPKYPRPVDCGEVYANGHNESGVYTVYPRGRGATCDTLEVYCDMDTDGGGWTVIQRRGNFGNAENFFTKNWQTYKTGFGNFNKEFWLGNDNIYVLTNQAQYSARFDLRRVNGDSAFALYDTFYIDDESQNYRLHLQEYSGTAGDAISNHHLFAFYTRDKPNLPNGRKPTDKQHLGGWWNNAFPSSNLNGLNRQGSPDSKAEMNGILWAGFGSPWTLESLGWTEIKVRSKKGR